MVLPEKIPSNIRIWCCEMERIIVILEALNLVGAVCLPVEMGVFWFLRSALKLEN